MSEPNNRNGNLADAATEILAICTPIARVVEDRLAPQQLVGGSGMSIAKLKGP